MTFLDTAWFCEGCQRPLENPPLQEDRPPEDTVTGYIDVAQVDYVHDQCGGHVALSTRVAEIR